MWTIVLDKGCDWTGELFGLSGSTAAGGSVCIVLCVWSSMCVVLRTCCGRKMGDLECECARGRSTEFGHGEFDGTYCTG